MCGGKGVNSRWLDLPPHPQDNNFFFLNRVELLDLAYEQQSDTVFLLEYTQLVTGP